jgi:hypothetical protein
MDEASQFRDGFLPRNLAERRALDLEEVKNKTMD